MDSLPNAMTIPRVERENFQVETSHLSRRIEFTIEA